MSLFFKLTMDVVKVDPNPSSMWSLSSITPAINANLQ